MSDFVFEPPATVSLPVHRSTARFPVRRVYCIGRNYAAHAVEMGHDPTREDPFFFQKSPDALVTDGRFPYPPESKDVHHEVELAVALHRGGAGIALDAAMDCVWGYGVALDMTRRDLQGVAKKAGRPWEIGKSFEASAPIGPLVPKTELGDIHAGEITLHIDGDLRQSGNLDQMIWKVPEIIAYLSRFFTLAPGDVILTGTPSGVGPVARGQMLSARIAGLPPLDVDVI